jgi:hypothetical protein
MGEMSDAVKAKEYSNAMARVAKAKERIERDAQGRGRWAQGAVRST